MLDGVGGARVAPGGYAEYEADRRRRREGGSPSRAPAAGRATPAGSGPATRTGRRARAARGGGRRRPSRGRPAPCAGWWRWPSGRWPRPTTAGDGWRRNWPRSAADHTALAAAAHALAEAEVALAAAEDRWLALTEELGA